MEATPKLNDEKPGDEAIPVSKVCLATTVVLRALLQQFSNSELVKLSLVNKQWNYEARSVLRDRGTLMVKIQSTHKDLAAFASVLHEMQVVPFAGMNVELSHIGSCRSTYKGSLDPSYDVILKRLPFKKLSVGFYGDWKECRDCPAFTLVKTILKDFGGALEELSLQFVAHELFELLQKFILNCSFPRLNTFKLNSDVADGPDFTKLVKELVSRLPNLQELHILCATNFDDNVLEGSSAVLVPNPSGFNPLYERVCESLVTAVRPKVIEIRRDEDNDFNPEVLNRFIPMILQASRTTLTTLRVDLLFAVPLMCYGICFGNVTKFKIYLNCSLLERLTPGLLALLKGFDFTRVLPKLSRVKINSFPESSFAPAEVQAFVEQGTAVSSKALPDRAINIMHLKFHDSVSDSAVQFLAQMFPNIKALSVTLGFDTPRVAFTILLEHFKYLEELEFIQIGHPRSVENLDSAFCGILPDEVAEMRKMDDDCLKTVNIVPVMPSIRCLQDLKKFTLCYRPRCGKRKKRDPNFIFSKVTGLIGFGRCPHLAVVFESDCQQALHHLKPYGSLKVNS